MNKIVFLLSLILVLLHFNVFSQEDKSSKVKLKTYYNFSRMNYSQIYKFSDYQYLWIQPAIEVNNVGEFSIGVIIEKNRLRSHEFELMPISIQHINFDETAQTAEEYYLDAFSKVSTTVQSRFRYQYNFIYPQKRFDLSFGLFSMANLFVQNFSSSNSSEFVQVFTQTGLVFGLTPGIEFPINEKLALSLDVPVGIVGLNMRRMNYKNPSISGKERIQTTLNSELWYQGFQVRLGLGFSL